MLTGELVWEFVRGAAEDRGLAEGVQPGTTAQQFGVSHAGGVRERGGHGRWKRRGLRPLGKRFAFPTFPPPRRRLALYRPLATRSGVRIMTPAETGGRSYSEGFFFDLICWMSRA